MNGGLAAERMLAHYEKEARQQHIYSDKELKGVCDTCGHPKRICCGIKREAKK